MQGISPLTAPSPSPPLARKRPRPNSFAAEDGDITLIEEVDNAKVVRDSEYYKEDADCRIRVEDTLFCIHRFLLERDSPTFQTMFQLPQGGEKPQGSTDEDPIVLSGDTAEQFRALCWALYALPDEITKQSDNGSAMEKLIRVAVISHKYQLAAFQSWSMGSIRRQCKSTQWGLQHNKYLNSCPPALFPALFHLSVLYGDEGLTNRIINAWVQRLQASGSTSIPLSGFSDAFKAADENHNRPFLGQLYYARLQVAPVAPVPTTNPSFDFPFEDLEYRDLQRILRGSWGLSSYWQSLISSVPELPKDSRCQHHSTRCRPEWARMWGKATIHGSATDIRQKLDYINTSCVDPGTMTAPCAVQARALVRSFITKMEKTLPDFFLGPP